MFVGLFPNSLIAICGVGCAGRRVKLVHCQSDHRPLRELVVRLTATIYHSVVNRRPAYISPLELRNQEKAFIGNQPKGA